ncbi:MAG: hypothetical protein JNM68_02300, partial [Dinghuibacter sp.]|nr:hypothetical protein [Dinghuibacter sp.]
TCAFGTRPVTINCPSFAGCPTQACPDTLTQPGNINPGAGFADAAGYGDYSGGDMYNDYMANSYEASTAGATGEFGGAAPAISINPVQCGFASQLCPSLVPVRCRTLLPLNSICCRPTMPNNTQCCLTRPSLCCTRPPVTPCGQTTNPVMCRQTILC